MNRREFLRATGTAAAISTMGEWVSAETPATLPATRPALPEASASRLPRWRGFNLLSKYNGRWNRPFPERDFALIAEWGMNFVRLPLSYQCWADTDDWMTIREAPLKELDAAVAFGRQYEVHVNLNLHRAPGYCVNDPPEPISLWTDEKALDACAFHWAHLAKRYRGIPSSQLSFNPLNEPKDFKEEVYVRVIKRLVEAIRAEDPQRLIIVDGLKWGTAPVPGLVDLHVAQSTRGYGPMPVTHYQARWVEDSVNWSEPTWPLTWVKKQKDGTEKSELWDKDRLWRICVEPWRQFQDQHVGVHVGEFGCHNRTPHEVVLAWMKDLTDLWREAGWGWALWNLNGSFGVLDSGRDDVAYESFRGHQLDRKMLELLREA